MSDHLLDQLRAFGAAHEAMQPSVTADDLVERATGDADDDLIVGRVRSWTPAVLAAAAAVVLVVGLMLVSGLSGNPTELVPTDSPLSVAPSIVVDTEVAEIEPDGIGPIDVTEQFGRSQWRMWEISRGGVPVIYSVGGRYVASVGDGVWESIDGDTWHPHPAFDEFGSVLVNGDFAVAPSAEFGSSGERHLFGLHDGVWTEVDVPDGPSGEVTLGQPITSGDVTLVPAVRGETGVPDLHAIGGIWRLDGPTVEYLDTPWAVSPEQPDTQIVVFSVPSGGFAAIGLDPVSGLAEAWRSPEGKSWNSVGPIDLGVGAVPEVAPVSGSTFHLLTVARAGDHVISRVEAHNQESNSNDSAERTVELHIDNVWARSSDAENWAMIDPTLEERAAIGATRTSVCNSGLCVQRAIAESQTNFGWVRGTWSSLDMTGSLGPPELALSPDGSDWDGVNAPTVEPGHQYVRSQPPIGVGNIVYWYYETKSGLAQLWIAHITPR